MTSRDVMMRSSPEFKKLINELKIGKLRNGTANKLLSDKRLTKAITRVPGLKDFILKSPLIEDLK